MDEQKIKKMIEIGGREWTTDNGKHRIYFNVDVLAPMVGLDLNFYGTGNISSASWQGESISNSQAKRILGDLDRKIHYDVIDKKWRCSGHMIHITLEEVVDIIKSKMGE